MLERSENGTTSVEVQDAGIVSRRPRSNINKDKGGGYGRGERGGGRKYGSEVQIRLKMFRNIFGYLGCLTARPDTADS